MIRWLRGPADPLPLARDALDAASEAPGLVAAGGDLGTARLADAYSKGIFPWFSDGQPVLWWSPDPRMVLLPAQFRLKRSLQKTLRRFVATPGCEVRIDSAFREVITACAGPRRGDAIGGLLDGDHDDDCDDDDHASKRPGSGTWIVPEMIEAYCEWHAEGTAHSVETWVDGRLVGGLYGVGLGRMFFGESMFTRATDASKIALAGLVAFCRANGIDTIDCQQRTVHLASLGGREIARGEFLARLGTAIAKQPVADWSYDFGTWRELGIEPAFAVSAAPPEPR